MTLKEMEELRRYLAEEQRDRARRNMWRHWRYLAETSITEDEEFYKDEGFYSVKEDEEEIPMTHEEWMDRAMAEYWRRIEEEENKKKEEIAMMTYEELWNKARQDIDDTGLFTEDEAEYQEDNSLILVDDIDRVYEACCDDLENGYEDEYEDIYGFLDRHGIEWQ